MDARLSELVLLANEKFGLEDYRLERHSLYRKIDSLCRTRYLLSMEWFPAHIKSVPDEDYNPDGTAVIEVNVGNGEFESAIFVGGKSYASRTAFSSLGTADMISWVERETKLVYGKQFKLQRKEEGELHFTASIHDVSVSPPGYIEVHYDNAGMLTFFSLSGTFPAEEMVQADTFELSLEKVEELALEQTKLIEYPASEQKKLLPLYGIEEIYIRNDLTATLPFDIIGDKGAKLDVDVILHWESPLKQRLNRQYIKYNDRATIEQALSGEQHPDLRPITKEEQERCIAVVTDLLRQFYPEDSGRWILKRLDRDLGYILATLRPAHPGNQLLKRKLGIFIDGDTLEVVNYIDNDIMLEEFELFESDGPPVLSREAAFEILKEHITVTPCYVYDPDFDQYVLCGKLDSQHAVHAGSGEVITLNEV
ncbi:hypothetical protein [Mesobacillus zeae]|uniref:DUF4901 domain-containing protein n=1 Tax=Mesobacillus zeae TaxID=1917180 RepID=A0A398B6Q2_9BACI|nr:hypothetical protein [Mesobacillus zeae]RID83590.1 hypothetical protein D1970_15575 [Mesobacillus zeae]